MPAESLPFAKFFTVEQANAALPLVRAITRDVAALSLDLLERKQRLAAIASQHRRQTNDPYSQELVQMEQDLAADTERLKEYIDELHALGVEPKNGPEGLVDFPAIIDGRPAYLCWKLSEPEILYWHDLETGFAGRQSLAAGAIVGDNDADSLLEDEPGA
ncbi:MAG TPA: DUF2203 domain-containing protein [Pirellulales bacterium]|jgi:hypothetical protein|nr:DUF2203 domain-containing protein [Pirellulales bacterium]